ncbi:MAG: antibiotic biosynthesis monooxygenase [Candidatus Thiodiazotropha sp.]|jgi:quinol monooxygenase YgiN
MSIRVTLNCLVKADQFNALLPFLEENLPNVRGFYGNTKVKVLFDENNNEMLLDEEWLSTERHQDYLKFISGNGVLEALEEFLVGPPQIKYFTLVDI